MAPRIGSNSPVARSTPAASTGKPTFKKTLEGLVTKRHKAGTLKFSSKGLPTGIRYARVPTSIKLGNSTAKLTLLIPTGPLAPKAKQQDPSKAPVFYLERKTASGTISFSGPIKTGVKPTPFFERLLEGQNGGRITTLKYPSDNEDGGDVFRPGGNVSVTEKYPSDNEEGGGSVGGGITTAKFPSDNEDGGTGVGGGGNVQTKKFPSDNEDGGTGVGGGGNVQTKKFPSDNDE